MTESHYFVPLYIAKLSGAVQFYLLGGYLAFLLMAAFLFYMQPQITLLESLRIKESQLRQTLSSTSASILPLDKLERELETLQKIENQLKGQLSKPVNLPQVVRDLSTLAEQNSLQLSSIVQIDTAKAGDMPIPELEIELYGRYRNLVVFFHFLSSAPYFVRFENLDWSRRRGGDDELHMQGRLSFNMGSLDSDEKS